MSVYQALFCRYRYDPLDRLASTQPAAQDYALRFYRKNRLATQIQGAIQHTFFGHDDQLLVQQQRSGESAEIRLLATDQQGSVLHGVDGVGIESRAYNAYGHHPAESGLSCLMGFNGEQRDPVTGHYLLGNGYRAFNPVLMRFNSPDELSPFDRGGLNAYAYCQGDPVNFRDPTGKAPVSYLIKKPLRMLDKTLKSPLQKTKVITAVAASKETSLRSAVLDDVISLQAGVPDTIQNQAKILSRLSPPGKVDARVWAQVDLEVPILSKEQVTLMTERLSSISWDSQLVSRLVVDEQGFIAGYQKMLKAVKDVRQVRGYYAYGVIASGRVGRKYKMYSDMVPVIDDAFIKYHNIFKRRYGANTV